MALFPPKRILVGADFSEPSFAACEQASSWARRFGAELRAVYARSPQPLELPTAPRVAGGEDALAEDLRAEFSRRSGGAPLEMPTGDPVVTLTRLAREWKAELIVVGTHGRNGVSRWLLGSVAEALLGASPVPVLAMREGPRTVQTILAPVKPAPYAEEAFRYAASVAAALGAGLDVRHIAAKDEDCPSARARLEALARELPEALRPRSGLRVFVSQGSADDIARFGAESDLIVLSAHRRGLWRDLVHGLTAQRVLRSARTPVLAVPTAEATADGTA